ncbi:MAG TPA: sigma 54-interacting transcriptional regulator [Bryobacteraceae bacterium]|nr:sigma 54-interacting transcriptional regulator [Bryobacteraceae bacterium]
MNSPLRILYLEDDPRDAELIQETLEVDGIPSEVVRVETEGDFIASLWAGNFDLILADYTLPSFDGLSALKIARKGWPQTPFIFVSGTLGEEVAIEALKIGATDYVFKTRLSRLVPSVQRALREARERLDLRRAEEALRRSEAYLAEAQRLSHTGSFGWNLSNGEIYWSRETFRIFALEPADSVVIDQVIQRTHPEDREAIRDLVDRIARDREEFDFKHRLLLPDGSVKYIRVVGHPSTDQPDSLEMVGAVTDVTESTGAEENLRNALDEIKTLRDQLYKENIALREEVDKASMFEEIVGGSPALQAVLARVAKVAPTDSTVLITGETGTGKELIARAIHKRSNRSSRAFVSVNCAAIPSTLIASELFGHEKGAFTGALQRRLGRFELADGGTIFLDEIGELPAETQIALLRVLQEREFERVGGSQPIKADVRVITATNRDLESAISAGAFRNDLFYRLNVFPIRIPPLRQRKEDISTLVEYFIHRYSRKAGKKIQTIEKRTLELLESYSWPGNIRELQNVIERSVIVWEADPFSVDPSWLSLECASSEEEKRPPATQERSLIETALAATGGRVSGPAGAAAQLGMPASTLESKIRSLKIDKYRFKSI